MTGSFFEQDHEFFEIVQRFQPKPTADTIVYHYTDNQGLLGITQTSELWATHFRFTNDSQEVQYGINLALQHIRDILEKDDDRHLVVDGIDAFFEADNLTPSELLLQVAERTLSDSERLFNEFYAYYFVCFSQNGDSLSQWRAYADDARGYSLGFRERDLRAISSRTQLGSSSLDVLYVIYKSETQDEMIDATIAMVARWCDDNGPKQPPHKRRGFIVAANAYLTSCILRLAVHMKHPGFEEERECRLIFSGKSNARPEIERSRASGNALVAYVPLPLQDASGRIPIEEIIIGPKTGATNSANNLQQTVENVFRQNQQQIPPVVSSVIPYR